MNKFIFWTKEILVGMSAIFIVSVLFGAIAVAIAYFFGGVFSV